MVPCSPTNVGKIPALPGPFYKAIYFFKNLQKHTYIGQYQIETHSCSKKKSKSKVAEKLWAMKLGWYT